MVNYKHSKNNVLLIIKRKLPGMNPALKKIGLLVLASPDKIKLLTINELARECQVSVSTVTRFVRAIDFKKFQELKIALAGMSTNDVEEASSAEKSVYDDITKGDTIEGIINKIAYKNIEALTNTTKLISAAELQRAVKAIEKADLLVFYCIGYARVAAENAKFRFYKIGKPCLVYSDPSQQAISSALLTPKSLAIGISNSGRTMPTIKCLKIAKEKGATTICITNYDHSPIVDYSDIKLFTSTTYSEFIQESMVSRICQCLVLDILYASYAVAHFDDSTDKIERATKSYRHFMNN